MGWLYHRYLIYGWIDEELYILFNAGEMKGLAYGSRREKLCVRYGLESIELNKYLNDIAGL